MSVLLYDVTNCRHALLQRNVFFKPAMYKPNNACQVPLVIGVALLLCISSCTVGTVCTLA